MIIGSSILLHARKLRRHGLSAVSAVSAKLKKVGRKEIFDDPRVFESFSTFKFTRKDDFNE